MSRRPQIPLTWRRAQESLGMRVVGVVPERLRRTEAGEHTRPDWALTAAAAGDVRWAPVVVVGDDSFPVTEWLVEQWRIETRVAMQAAFAATHRRVSAERFTLRTVGPCCWQTDGPEHPAWLLRPEVLSALLAKGFRTPGDPVLLVATDGSALLAGADDPVGLATMADLATQQLRDHPLAAVTAEPLRWRDGWTPLEWPTAAGARRPDRAAYEQLTAAVDRLRRAFDDACATIAQTTRRDGLPIRRALGVATRDETVLAGWEELALALGATVDVAAEVRSAATDSLTWFDTRAAQLSGFDSTPDRPDFRPEHVLAGALHTAGLLLVLGRKVDPATLGADLAALPVVQATGHRPVLADGYDSTTEMAEDVAAQLNRAGLHLVCLGDGGDLLWVVPVSDEQTGRVDTAVRQIGDPTLLTYL